jgi:hypothetical protein
MNKATVADQTSISTLVEKHLAELEELQLKYKQVKAVLNKKQKAQFREFILKFHTLEHAELLQELELEPEENLNDRKWHRRWFKLRDQP